MVKQLALLFSIISILLIITGCSSPEKTIEQAVEELNYDVLVPSYVPSDLALNYTVLEEELFIQNYANEEESVFIELTQDHDVKGLNIERLMEFLETGTDPYEEIPDLAYAKIGNFIGEYKNFNDSLSYMFIPTTPRTEIEEGWYPSYWITANGMNEDEFQKVIESLE